MQAAADSAGYHAARRGRHHHSASFARSTGYGEGSGHSADCENTEYDKVVGLDTGADDYIPKPFGMMELIARIRAVLRRTEDMQDKNEPRPLVAGGICVDERAHTVFVNEQEVQLTLKEYQLLCLLMKNRGAVLTRDVLLENIWGYNNESETRTVDVHIRTLRQKLGADGALIETVRGVGYRMGEHT